MELVTPYSAYECLSTAFKSSQSDYAEKIAKAKLPSTIDPQAKISYLKRKLTDCITQRMHAQNCAFDKLHDDDYRDILDEWHSSATLFEQAELNKAGFETVSKWSYHPNAHATQKVLRLMQLFELPPQALEQQQIFSENSKTNLPIRTGTSGLLDTGHDLFPIDDPWGGRPMSGFENFRFPVAVMRVTSFPNDTARDAAIARVKEELQVDVLEGLVCEDVGGQPTIAIHYHPSIANSLFVRLTGANLKDLYIRLTPECKELINRASAKFCQQWDKATRHLTVQPHLPVGVPVHLHSATLDEFERAVSVLLAGGSFCLGEMHDFPASDFLRDHIESIRDRTIYIEHLPREAQGMVDAFLINSDDSPIPIELELALKTTIGGDSLKAFLIAARQHHVRVVAVGSVMAESIESTNYATRWGRVNKLNAYATLWISQDRIGRSDRYIILAGGSHTGQSIIVNRNACLITPADETRVPGLAAAFGVPSVKLLNGVWETHAVVSHDELQNMSDDQLNSVGRNQRDGKIDVNGCYLLVPKREDYLPGHSSANTTIVGMQDLTLREISPESQKDLDDISEMIARLRAERHHESASSPTALPKLTSEWIFQV